MNDIGSCPTEFCPMFSTIIYLLGHDIAQILLSMTDVGSCHNKFCLRLFTRLCLVSRDIAQ